MYRPLELSGVIRVKCVSISGWLVNALRLHEWLCGVATVDVAKNSIVQKERLAISFKLVTRLSLS